MKSEWRKIYAEKATQIKNYFALMAFRRQLLRVDKSLRKIENKYL
jgi:hypothetical protein